MWVSIEQLVSMNTALADGLALKESGAYAEALKVLALSNAPEAAAAILEIHFILGEQAMAEYYLTKIPALHFFFYEIAAAIKTGQERLENVKKAEDLCIDKLICMLAMRKAEAETDEAKAQIDRQARDMLSFFKSYPIYRTMAELMERGWNDGTLMAIYQ